MIKTVKTVAGVNKILFDEFYRYFWIKNKGAANVHVSARCTIGINNDCTAELCAGDIVRVDNWDDRALYVLGASEIEVHADDIPDCPFKLSAKGGATVDDAQNINAVEYPLIGLNMYGASTQDGTPTPENPVDIVSVGDDGAVDIVLHGKNLFDFEAWKNSITNISNGTAEYGNNSIKLTASNTDCHTLPFGSGYTIPVLPNTTYTFSFSSDNDLVGTNYLFFNGSNSNFAYAGNAAGKKCTFTTANDTSFLTVRFGVLNSGESITYSNIQLEKGENVTKYEQFKGNTTVTITSGLPLCSVGDVRDELVYRADGTGKIIKRTAKTVFDGTNEKGIVMSYDETTGVIQWRSNFLTNVYINNGSVWGNGLCSHAEYSPVVSMAFSHFAPILDNNYLFLRCWFKDIGTKTTEELNVWLQSNPVTFVYQIEPQEIELTAAEMTALTQLQTFDGVTNVYNDENAEMNVKCCTNPMLSEYVYPLIKRLTDENAELKAAVLSLGGNV